MSKDFIERLVELLKEDTELHLALLEFINARTEAELELAAWRKRRK